MQKIFIGKFFAPLRSKKIQGKPLLAMKITGQPHRKACKLIFSGPPLQGSKMLRAPFLHQEGVEINIDNVPSIMIYLIYKKGSESPHITEKI